MPKRFARQMQQGRGFLDDQIEQDRCEIGDPPVAKAVRGHNVKH